MPKRRICSLCGLDSIENPEVTFFKIDNGLRLICDSHVHSRDVIIQGSSKRLKSGAQILQPKSTLLDHSYSSNKKTKSKLSDDEVIRSNSWTEDDTLPVVSLSNSGSEEEILAVKPSNLYSSETEDDTIPDKTVNLCNYGTKVDSLVDKDANKCNSLAETDSPALQQSSGELWSENEDLEGISSSDSDGDMTSSPSNTLKTNSHILVNWSCLLSLFRKCTLSGCSKAVLEDDIHTYVQGACVDIKFYCEAGHVNSWSSSPKIKYKEKSVPKINITAAGYLFLSGMQYKVFKEFCIRMELPMISPPTYYKYLNDVVYPVTYDYWLEQQGNLVNEAIKGQSATGGVRLCGDARFDSVGFSAKFATYYMQDFDSKFVLGVYVASKHQVSNSAEMDVYALRSLLNWFRDVGLCVKVVATDRSTKVKKVMDEEYPETDHEFDVWHYVKKQ